MPAASGRLPGGVRREHIAGAAHCLDHLRVRRVRLDLAADAGDADVDRAVESLRVARLRQIEQPLARKHTFRIFGESLEKTELRGRQWMLVSLLVAERAGVEIEPFRAHF